jgi:hypothetical protein
MATRTSVCVRTRVAVWCFVSIALFATRLAAQTERGTVEITAVGGILFNVRGPSATVFSEGLLPNGTFSGPSSFISQSGKKTHPLFGGGVAVALSDWIWLYGDSIYSGLGRVTASAGGNSATASESIVTFGGGVRFQFLRRSRINPYVSLGVGQYRAMGRGSVSCGPVTLSTFGNYCASAVLVSRQDVNGGTPFLQFSGEAFVNATTHNGLSARPSVGARYRISERWGVRVSLEYGYFRHFSDFVGDRVPLELSGGLFFQTK